MSDKTQELNRINEPRVRRVLDQLTFIEKSAASLRAPELDVATLLKPVATKLAQLYEGAVEAAPAPVATPLGAAPIDTPSVATPLGAAPIATPPVAREMEDLQELTTQQLVDRMIACGALLAERRK